MGRDRRARVRCRFGPIALMIVAVPAALLAGLTQGPSLRDVLVRATRYVDALHGQLSALVAEERYEQRVRGGGGARRWLLRSDFLLIQPEGADRYYGFRDVFEVDRRPVRNRDERLAKLFLDGTASADRQIEGIRSESALYNIGAVERNFNTPTYALLFLRASHKLRFEFEGTTDVSLPLGLDDPSATEEIYVLRFRETWPRTIIRGRDGRNMPAEGRFWIESESGRVLATELNVQDQLLKATIAVTFEKNEELGHLVPSEMRERYDNREEVSRVDGTATYSRFRQFSVEVTESR